MFKILLISLIVLVIFFVGRQSTRFLRFSIRRKLKIAPVVPYWDNPTYKEQTEFFKLYTGKYNIVMVGDSLTQRVHWNELLNNGDIANRGIGNDTAEGIVNRLETVLSCNPKIVFLMVGINDIANGVVYVDYLKHMRKIIETLVSNRVRVVVCSILHVTKGADNAEMLNKNVWLFNNGLEKLVKEIDLSFPLKSVDFIDYNISLCHDGELQSYYAQADGVHLTGKAYKIIRERMEIYLDKVKFE